MEALDTDSRLSELTLESFLERLASDAPVPGGGSAAALAAAMGASLVHMVVALSEGRPHAEGREDVLREMRLAAAGLQSELLELAQADAAAYASVIAARRLPRDTERERQARLVQIQVATREAIRAPLEVARRAADVLALSERLAPIGSRRAISDVGVAGLLAAAGLRGAIANVDINVPSLADDDPLREEARAARDELLAGLDERERALRRAVADRLE